MIRKLHSYIPITRHISKKIKVFSRLIYPVTDIDMKQIYYEEYTYNFYDRSTQFKEYKF